MKMTEIRKTKLKNFLSDCEMEIFSQLTSIKCKCFFTMLLYGYLIRKTEISDSQEINIHHICNMTGVSRNTVQKAFRELLSLELVSLANDAKQRFANQPHKIVVNRNSVLNDNTKLINGEI